MDGTDASISGGVIYERHVLLLAEAGRGYGGALGAAGLPIPMIHLSGQDTYYKITHTAASN